MKRIVLGIAVALLLGLLPIGPVAQAQQIDILKGAEFEKAFLAEMIVHHQMAVMMAQPVAERAPHVELRALARTIVATQSAEIVQMQGWLRDWYGISAPGMVGMMQPGMMQPGMMQPGMMQPGMMPDKEMMDMMNALQGGRLEAVFMSMMVIHHQDAVAKAWLARDYAAHDEVKRLASAIITSQTAEIQQMNGWLTIWYNL